MSDADAIPAFYRLCFATLEPAMAILGFFVNHINPVFLLQSFYPPYDDFSSVSPETRILLDNMIGPRMQTLFLPIIISRARPNDVSLWKIWQGSLLVRDLFFMLAVIQTTGLGSLLYAPLRWNLDQLINVTVVVCFVVARLAFVLDLKLEGLVRRNEKKE